MAARQPPIAGLAYIFASPQSIGAVRSGGSGVFLARRDGKNGTSHPREKFLLIRDLRRAVTTLDPASGRRGGADRQRKCETERVELALIDGVDVIGIPIGEFVEL